jgi:hypothetical protein
VYDTPHAGTGNAKSKAWLVFQAVEGKVHPHRAGCSFLMLVGIFDLVVEGELEMDFRRLEHVDCSS